jgi:hypothetical protein
MTPEELKARLEDLARRLSAAREDLGRLLPELASEPDRKVTRGLLDDLACAVAHCTALGVAAATGQRAPVACSLGPRLPGVIYSLTTVGADPAEGNTRYPFGQVQERMRRRTVGFFWTAEQAEEVLAHNHGHLDEAGWYRWAVVGQMPAGLYPRGDGQRWWEFDPPSET